MRYKLSILSWLLIAAVACNPKSSTIDPTYDAYCKKITIDNDGDAFTYEFDKTGKLLSIDGRSVADYYTKNTCEVKEQLGNQTVVLIAFKDNLWRQRIVDATGDGFRIYYNPEIINGETKITGKNILGATEGDDSFRDDVEYKYDANGNCKAEYGNISLDGAPMLYHETTYKYNTDKPSPFWKHPFQWFLELPWADGHTNQHLPVSAYFSVVNFDDQGNIYGNDENQIDRWGDINYSYSYDSKGRLSRIQIDKIENVKITHLPTGNKKRDTTKTQKTITLVYDC